jgi:hypothetical protein
MKTPMRAFMAAIFVVGVIRFALTVSGVPNSMVKFVSMSVVLTAGTIYFALTIDSRRERLKAAYLLILPYMVIEVAALGYTWATGHPTIFHTVEYSFGTSIAVHTLGHLIGGLTWEPLLAFGLMEVLWQVKRRMGRAVA